MRMIFGMVVGFALTVGGAYFVDHATSDGVTRPMVNWDVVAKNVDHLGAFARDSWRRLTG